MKDKLFGLYWTKSHYTIQYGKTLWSHDYEHVSENELNCFTLRCVQC